MGSKIPKYLVKNIHRTHSLFPTFRIFLIHDARSIPSEDLGDLVTLWEYSREYAVEHGEAAPDLSHDPKFWSGYWQHTFERLFAVGQFQKYVDGSPVLHVESDVILFPGFPFTEIRRLKTLAWSRVSETYDVAAIVFSPNAQAISDLLYALRTHALSNPKTNDMLALAEFSRDFPDKFSELPPRLEQSLDQNLVATNPALGHGIFDGMPLGYWFSGRDPKSYWGIRERYLTPLASPLDYSKSKFSVNNDGELFVDELPVFSLHVHSKNLGYFEEKNSQFLKAEVDKVLARRNRRNFSISALLIFLRTNYKDFLMAVLSYAKWKSLLSRKFSIK